MGNITPFLWFDNNLDEAIKFYFAIFKDHKLHSAQRIPDARTNKPGAIQTAEFELNGQRLKAMNAGPQFKFNEAISLFVLCKTQREVDRYWRLLTANGGQESMCGWLKDKFGLSWQIVPEALMTYIGDPNPVKAQRAIQAMLKMRRIDIAAIKKAHAGK